MLCDRVSLFTKRTRLPREIVTLEGLTPPDVIVIVAEPLEEGSLDGAVDDPPQVIAPAARKMAANPRAMARGIASILSRLPRGRGRG